MCAFTKKQKEKMRKQRYRKIVSSLPYIFCHVKVNNEYHEVLDISKDGKHVNLLVEKPNGEYAVLKAIGTAEYVEMSRRSLSFLRNKFSNPSIWDRGSFVGIDEDGSINVVRNRRYLPPPNCYCMAISIEVPI